MGRTERFEQPREFGKYQLIARLAQGRMGDVFKAKSHGVEGFEKVFCLKVIHPAYAANPQFVDTLIDEAKRSVALSHANIAQVIDLGHEENQQRYYVAMEFIGGLDLERAIRLAKTYDYPWSRELSVFIISEAAKALDYAHRRKDFNFQNLNILHRALRPQNIILSYDGEVKITDFGLSRALEVIDTLDGDDVIQRVKYDAPELLRGHAYTRQCDIFSLGLLFYQMLAGFHPYDGATAEEVQQKAMQAAIEPISNFVDIPRPLQQILESMLVADPNGRASSAGQLYEELIGYIFGNSLQADNRMLSIAMQELRRRDTNNNEFIDLTEESDLEEISNSDLKSAFATGGALDTANLPKLPARALPSSKPGASTSADGPFKALPGALENLYDSARQGRGKAVLLSGRLGRGREVLLDRLVDAVDERPQAHAMLVFPSEDDQFRPFGAFSDLILRSLHQTLRESLDHRESALQTLQQWGVPDEAIETMATIWDLRPPSASETPRSQHFAAILWALMREFSQDGTFVLAIDRVERLDRVSLDALRGVIATIGNLPVLLVLGTSQEKGMRTLFDVGTPRDLEAIRVNGDIPPTPAELASLRPDAERLLRLLSLASAPMLPSDAASLLDLSHQQTEALAEELAGVGAIRILRPNFYVADVSNYLTWRRTQKEDGEEQRLATNLARFLMQRRTRKEGDRLTPKLLRLLCISGDRRHLLSLANRYGQWLESRGWQHTTLHYYRHLGDLLGRFGLGIPQIRMRFLLEAGQLALKMANIDLCRTILEPLSTLAETTRNEQGFVGAQLLLGHLAMQQDDLEEAQDHFQRSLQTARGIKDPELLASASLALAGWYERFGDSAHALRFLESALNIATRYGTQQMNLHLRAQLLQRAARMWADRGMAGRARRPVNDLVLMARALPHPSIQARTALAQGRLAAHVGEIDNANRFYDQALGLANAYDLAALSVELIRERASLNLRYGQYENAISWSSQIIGLAESQGDYYSEQRARDIRALAQTHLHREVEASLEQLRTSLRRATERGVPKDVFRGHDFLARALEAVERLDEAAHHRNHARRLGQSMRISWAA